MIGRNSGRTVPASPRASSVAIALMVTTCMAGVPEMAAAQQSQADQKPARKPSALFGKHARQTAPASAVPVPASPAPAPAAPPVVAEVTVKTITIDGAQRLEPDTIRSYIRLREGDRYTQAAADQVLKDLFATELFSDVQLRNNNGDVVIQVKENPVVNRIILEGNKRLKEDKILPEIKLSAREFGILHALMENPGVPLSRSQLEDRLYGWQEEIGSNAVEVHIHALRRKLGSDWIRNVRGVGYMVPRQP